MMCAHILLLCILQNISIYQIKQQVIAKAYEVLTDSTKRAEYDHFRDRPDEYFRKYGSGVLWEYAPKSDASFVIILFLIAGSAFTYYAQKSRWQKIANHLIKAAVEDASAMEGGSAESVEIREKALEILAQKKAENGTVVDDGHEQESGGKKGKAGDKKKKGSKLNAKEKKEKEMEELRPIVVELVNEIDDFGAGFRKPTMHDLLGEFYEIEIAGFDFRDCHDVHQCIIQNVQL
jgi:DnaJ family protein C protein 25